LSQRSNEGTGIKSTAGLELLCTKSNGDSAFVHPLKFDILLQ